MILSDEEAPPRVDEPPSTPLTAKQARCPECGEIVSKSNLAKHRRERHGVEPAKRSRAQKAQPVVSFEQQVTYLYQLGGQVLSTRMPVTGGAVIQQSVACAKAWDAFLERYPAFKEMLEKGMVAGDIAALVMAHVPIITAARMELAERQAQTQQYNPQAGAETPIG